MSPVRSVSEVPGSYPSRLPNQRGVRCRRLISARREDHNWRASRAGPIDFRETGGALCGRSGILPGFASRSPAPNSAELDAAAAERARSGSTLSAMCPV